MCPRIDPFIVKCKERIEAMKYIVGRLSVGRKDGWISDAIMTPIVFRVQIIFCKHYRVFAEKVFRRIWNKE
jgi:hypothetical protein